jgi:hypothetical protein
VVSIAKKSTNRGLQFLDPVAAVRRLYRAISTFAEEPSDEVEAVSHDLLARLREATRHRHLARHQGRGPGAGRR